MSASPWVPLDNRLLTLSKFRVGSLDPKPHVLAVGHQGTVTDHIVCLGSRSRFPKSNADEHTNLFEELLVVLGKAQFLGAFIIDVDIFALGVSRLSLAVSSGDGNLIILDLGPRKYGPHDGIGSISYTSGVNNVPGQISNSSEGLGPAPAGWSSHASGN